MNADPSKRYIFIIRILFYIILINSFDISLYSQDSVFDQKLNLHFNNTRIATVLKSLTRKTGYEFTYDTDLIKPDSVISINIDDIPLAQIFDLIYGKGIIGYTTVSQHIILFKAVDENTSMLQEEGRESVYIISGKVLELGTNQPLAYASLGIAGKGKGTISNYDGGFSLKVTPEDLSDSLVISYLGFKNMLIPINALIGNNYEIKLEREYISIPEVIIRTREPIELIRNIHRNIPANYGHTPAMLTAFYRESITRRTKLQEYSEAVLEIYKSPYTKSLQLDQIKLYKSRKIVNTDRSDTLVVKLKAGLNACLTLDGIRHSFDFIEEENIPFYDYRMVDIVSFDDEAAYVIEFKQKDDITDVPLFKGYIYINTDNYGVHSVEFEINEKYIDKIDREFIPQSSRGFNIKVRKVKYKVDYRYINGRYYLNHVRGDLELFARKKKTLFGSPYYVSFEMATTDIDTVNITRFNRTETISANSVFSNMVSGYDSDFWGTDNFLKPESSIEEALKRIDAKLSNFEKDQ